MSFQLSRTESVEAGVQRVVKEQLARAIAELKNAGSPPLEAVHQVRKRCKKIRSALRLVRPCFGNYREENARFRDAAKGLAGIRDAVAMIETNEKLLETSEGVEARELKRFNAFLNEHKKQAVGRQRDPDKDVRELLKIMRASRLRVRNWELSENGFAALRGGFKKTYRRGQKAMTQARREPTSAHFHEWRKRVKYHWYHVRLVQRIWKRALKCYRRELKHLADLLGDHHDLAVLRNFLDHARNEFRPPFDLEVVARIIGQKQSRLETEALTLGAFVFAAKPKRIAKRFGRYWSLWRSQ